jgi:hypothetical protein
MSDAVIEAVCVQERERGRGKKCRKRNEKSSTARRLVARQSSENIDVG